MKERPLGSELGHWSRMLLDRRGGQKCWKLLRKAATWGWVIVGVIVAGWLVFLANSNEKGVMAQEFAAGHGRSGTNQVEEPLVYTRSSRDKINLKKGNHGPCRPLQS